jgi:nicotinate-nucleotide adenylyltransferase
LKLGIFGGTLNPMHFGHLRAAEEAREAFSLDKVVFVPAAIPPFKKPEVEPPYHRMEMARIAIEGNPYFELSDIEVRRGGVSYSIDTVEELKKGLPDAEVYFILGVDAFLDIDSWKDYRRFLSLCSFIIVTRPGYEKRSLADSLPLEVRGDFCYDSAKGCYVHSSGHCLQFLEVTLLDISSTEIRKRLKAGKSVKYLLPGKVEEYIKKHGLYGSHR